MAGPTAHTFTSSLSELKMMLKELPSLCPLSHAINRPINFCICQELSLLLHAHTLLNKLGAHRESNEKVNYAFPQETV